MLQPGRSYSSTSAYRYGFNGKEEDSLMGGGNGIDYNYGYRIYDARISKFLSIDPLGDKYPGLTPYQFASNNPISGIDLDGREFDYYLTMWFVDIIMEYKHGVGNPLMLTRHTKM